MTSAEFAALCDVRITLCNLLSLFFSLIGSNSNTSNAAPDIFPLTRELYNAS